MGSVFAFGFRSRGGRDVIAVGVEFGDEAGQEFVVDFSAVEFFSLSEFCTGVKSIDFVVAAPESEGGVVSQLCNDGGGFGFYEVGEPLSVGVICGIEHEVLPDEDSEAVAKVVEIIGFVTAAGPDTKHIQICIDGVCEKVFVIGV